MKNENTQLSSAVDTVVSNQKSSKDKYVGSVGLAGIYQSRGHYIPRASVTQVDNKGVVSVGLMLSKVGSTSFLRI